MDKEELRSVINNINIGDDVNIDQVLSIIQSIENGNEPIMFKICMGTATPEEINRWVVENNIPAESVDDVINGLKDSFTEGINMAANDNCNNNIMDEPETSDDVILDKLNSILDQLSNINKEVLSIAEIVKNR